jgi:membrane protein implicated in regulation of membrane protease activity
MALAFMSVKVSPISRGAAILVVVVGLFTIALVNLFAGIAFVVLGMVLYWLLYRFARKVRREIEGVNPDKPSRSRTETA